MFETFKIILFSQKIDQSYRNKLFPSLRIDEFLKILIYYDVTTPLKDENVKLDIASNMVKVGLSYYQSRFQASKFFSSKINEAIELLTSINQLISVETSDEEAMNFYRMRKHMKTPPEIWGGKDLWYSLCMICWRYNSGKTKDEAMKGIKHEKNCTYDKNRLEHCTKSVPPNSSEIR